MVGRGYLHVSPDGVPKKTANAYTTVRLSTSELREFQRNSHVRESLGVPDTQKNRKVAGELRASVCFSIKTGIFNYSTQFPDSPNLKRFGVESREITVLELANKWLELKHMEISTNAMSHYASIARNMVPRIRGHRLVSAVTQKDQLFIRKELLTGYHTLKTGQKTPVKGRYVRTVN